MRGNGVMADVDSGRRYFEGRLGLRDSGTIRNWAADSPDYVSKDEQIREVPAQLINPPLCRSIHCQEMPRGRFYFRDKQPFESKTR